MSYYKERYRSEHHLARYDEDTIENLNLAAQGACKVGGWRGR